MDARRIDIRLCQLVADLERSGDLYTQLDECFERLEPAFTRVRRARAARRVEAAIAANITERQRLLLCERFSYCRSAEERREVAVEMAEAIGLRHRVGSVWAWFREHGYE